MSLHIRFIDVMNVVRCGQVNVKLLIQTHQPLIHRFLIRYPMILEFQKEISLSKYILKLQSGRLRLIVQAAPQKRRDNAGQAGAQRNDPLVIGPQHLVIHPWFIVIPFGKSPGYDLHQIGIAGIVLRQQHQMMVPALVLPAALPVKPRAGRHIHLTANHRIDPRRLRRPVKIDHPVHHTVIRNGKAVHPQFFRPADQFPDLTGAVQQAVFRMYM